MSGEDYAPIVKIYGIELTVKNTGIVNYGTGILTLASSTTYGSPTITSGYQAIRSNNSGTININEGTLISEELCIYNNSSGRINIGSSSSTSSTSPSITGSTYGIWSTSASTGTIYVYSGKVTGVTKGGIGSEGTNNIYVGTTTSTSSTAPNITGETYGIHKTTSSTGGDIYVYSGKVTGNINQGVYSASSGRVQIGTSSSVSSTVPTIVGATQGIFVYETGGAIYVYSGKITGKSYGGVTSNSTKNIYIGSSTSTSSTAPTITGATHGVSSNSTDSSTYIYVRSGKITGQGNAGVYFGGSSTGGRVVIGNTTNTADTTTSSTSTTKSLAVSPTISGKTYGVQLSSSSLKLGTFNSGRIQGITAATNGTLGTVRSGYTTATTTATYSSDAVITSGTYKRTYIKSSS